MHFIISKKLYNRQNSPISPDNSQITFHKHGLFGNSQEVSVIRVIVNSVMHQKTPKFGGFFNERYTSVLQTLLCWFSVKRVFRFTGKSENAVSGKQEKGNSSPSWTML